MPPPSCKLYRRTSTSNSCLFSVIGRIISSILGSFCSKLKLYVPLRLILCQATGDTFLVSVSLFNMLTSDSLLDKVEELLPKHRERLYPPTETLSMFLSQAMSSDRSCQNSVNKSVIHRVGDGLSICSTKTGGYCRARKRLPEAMVSKLTRHLGSMIYEQTTELWRWKKDE